MTVNRSPSRLHRIGTLLTVAVVAGCSSATSPAMDVVPPNVTAFILDELPKVRQINVDLRDDATGILIFSASYGELQDCPAGCFYAKAWGLAYRGQIGWISAPGPTATVYDVKPNDSGLFECARLRRSSPA